MHDETNCWYAVKVLYGRIHPLLRWVEEMDFEVFVPSEVIPNLLFVCCREEEVIRLQYDNWGMAWVYRMADKRRPAAIPQHEMDVFRFVVSAGRDGLTLLGDDRPEYHEGDRVVVTDGPFKGAEGHIHRIKRDRRLVVAIRGVVAVATTYIHPSLLRKVNE